MIARITLAALVLSSQKYRICQGFTLSPVKMLNRAVCTSSFSSIVTSSSELHMAMNRKSRRQNQGKETTSSGLKKPKFADLMVDADKKSALQKNQTAMKNLDTDHIHYIDPLPQEGLQKEDFANSPGSVLYAPVDKAADRTSVPKMKRHQVLDLVTGKSVALSDQGPMARMAQFSPGVPPDVREALRFDMKTIRVPEMIQKFTEASLIDGKIPPFPQVSNKAIDFFIANKDYLGIRMKKTLMRLRLRNQSEGMLDEAQYYKQLLSQFQALESHVTGPFKQIVLDSEAKIGPNFGNLDVRSYCAGELNERCAAYIVLKAMVVYWEKKVRDADYYTNTPRTEDNFFLLLSTGDPRRYLRDSQIIHRLDECVKICARAQQMMAEFVNAPELFNDLPTEIRFIEKALTIQGGTELRRFMLKDFCPQEGITPEGLREGLRRLYDQMTNMSADPYGTFTILIGKLERAMGRGSDDEINPYEEYLLNIAGNREENPGWFQTYTFNQKPTSLVRFLDTVEEEERESEGKDNDDMFGRADDILPDDDVFENIGKVSCRLDSCCNDCYSFHVFTFYHHPFFVTIE